MFTLRGVNIKLKVSRQNGQHKGPIFVFRSGGPILPAVKIMIADIARGNFNLSMDHHVFYLELIPRGF